MFFVYLGPSSDIALGLTVRVVVAWVLLGLSCAAKLEEKGWDSDPKPVGSYFKAELPSGETYSAFAG